MRPLPTGADRSLSGAGGPGAAAQKKVAPASIAATSSHSTTIALTSDKQRVVVVNREANSVSIIRVKNMQATISPPRLPKSALAKSLAAWLSTLTTRKHMSPMASPVASRWLIWDSEESWRRSKGSPSRGLRSDGERLAPLCGQPYRWYRVHCRHRLAKHSRGRGCWARSDRPRDHEQRHREYFR